MPDIEPEPVASVDPITDPSTTTVKESIMDLLLETVQVDKDLL